MNSLVKNLVKYDGYFYRVTILDNTHCQWKMFIAGEWSSDCIPYHIAQLSDGIKKEFEKTGLIKDRYFTTERV